MQSSPAQRLQTPFPEPPVELHLSESSIQTISDLNEPQTQHILILSNNKIYSQSQFMQALPAQGLQTPSPDLADVCIIL